MFPLFFFVNFSLSFIVFLSHSCLFCFLRYYRFNENSRSVDSDYPKPINVWQGVPDNIKGAFMSEDGGTEAFVLSCGFSTVKSNKGEKSNKNDQRRLSNKTHTSYTYIFRSSFKSLGSRFFSLRKDPFTYSKTGIVTGPILV